jgi:dTDP-4-dehydrorhamnose reductase
VGRAFLAAEQVLAQTHEKAVCLRLSWVVGSYGQNHLTRLLDHLLGKGAADESFTVNSRLRGAPTVLSDAARVAVAITKQIICGAGNWGVMHYCSGESCTEAEFAAQVVQVLQQLQKLDEGVVLATDDSLPETEPVSGVLICRRVRDYFGVQARAWRPNLLPMIKQWLHTHDD